jgi:hypothetical protein
VIKAQILNFIMVVSISTTLLSSCGTNSDAFMQVADGPCTSKQKEAIADHISSQIKAIAKEDWPKAYQYAAESFQESIPLITFEEIIKGQYQMIINHKGYQFTNCTISAGKFMQRVKMVAVDGEYELIYRLAFEKMRLGVEAATVAPIEAGLAT